MKAKNLMIRGSLLAASMALAVAAQAADIQWLQAGKADFSANTLVRNSAEAPLSANANRNQELVQFQWALDTNAPIVSADNGSSNESRQYWLDVSAGELSRGVELNTTGKGAVIRISPQSAAGAAVLSQDAIQLSLGGRALDKSNIASFANSQQLSASGAPFAEGTVAFRLGDQVNGGKLTLSVANNAAADAKYVVHVYEPNSAMVAKLSSAKSNYLAGAAINLNLEVAGAQGSARGFLVSPDGKTTLPLNFSQKGAAYTANIAAPASQGQGLWEVHSIFEGQDAQGNKVLRDTKTAINITAATARLNQNAQLAGALGSKSGNVALQFGVDVAAAGRYQVSGVLYGTGKDGQLHPIALAQSAQWLEAGSHQLPLSFDVSKAEVGAPFEVRDLRLQDQSRLGDLHRQARAVIIR